MNFKHIMIAALAGFLLGVLFTKCNPNLLIECEQMDCYEAPDTVTVTTYTKGETDTIVRYVSIKADGTPIKESIDTTSDSTRTYKHTYKDSTVEAEVTTMVTGTLDSQSLKYTVTVPEKYITRVDTLKLDNTIYIKPKNYHRFYGGAQIQGNASFIQYGFNVAYQNPKNKFIYEVGYNFNNNLGNNLMLGVKIPIFKIKTK